MQTFKYYRSLFLAKLFLPFILISLLGSATLISLLYFSGGEILEEQVRRRILDEFNFLQYEYREDGPDELLEEIAERLEKSQQSWRYLYSVRAPNGDLAFDVLPRIPNQGWSRLSKLEYAESTLLLTRELGPGYQLSVGLAEDDLYAYRQAFFTHAGWLFMAGALLSALFGLFVYWRFIRIVRQLALPVQKFTEGSFDVRIPLLNAGPDLDRLAHNINKMFEHIERLIEQLKQLSDNVAHDLRTPLTRVKNQLYLAGKSAGGEAQLNLLQADRELDEVLRLFSEILQLSEIKSGGLQTHFKKFDISKLICECIDIYQPLLEEKHIATHTTMPDKVIINGSPQLMKQVMVNLIENTLSHSSGNCQMCFDLTLDQDKVQLFVQDDGTVDHHSHSKKHFGIGLKFVSAIIELHGGQSSFGAKSDGGFCCRIDLPQSKPTAEYET